MTRSPAASHLLLSLLLLLPGAAPAAAQTQAELQSAAFRAKPAVVMIGVEVGATFSVRCGRGEASTVTPSPLQWIGSGAIIHPDGWIMTNGHVVQPFHEDNAAQLAPALLERAVVQACAGQLGGAPAGSARVRALAAAQDMGPVRLEKRLQVTLSNSHAYAATVRGYSPPAYVVVGRTTGGGERRGRDVAIIKIEGRDLPVVELAPRSTDLHLGQRLFVLGFPGVVAAHELLSTATRFEPSLTVGRVSGFKQDVGGQRVIQTDAAIIQGNSGGPVFNERGQVVGAATFTSQQGEQVVQGFNFVVPVESLHELAGGAGLVPQGQSRFTRLWNAGVDLYIRGNHYRAYRNMNAASQIHPGFPDVERVKEDCLLKHTEQGYLQREEVQWAVAGGAVLATVAGLWAGGRLARRRLDERMRRVFREVLAASRSPSPGS